MKCENLLLGKWDCEGRVDRGQNDGNLNVKNKCTKVRKREKDRDRDRDRDGDREMPRYLCYSVSGDAI